MNQSKLPVELDEKTIKQQNESQQKSASKSQGISRPNIR